MKEQYLSDIPWSFDLKITYMDEQSRLAKLPYCIRNQNVVQCIRIEKSIDGTSSEIENIQRER